MARYDYDPYGQREKIAGTTTFTFTCDFGFTGHHTHAGTGLVLTLYRAYDPALGVWLSADPLGESQNHYGNLYAYGPNNPLSGFDPLGGSFIDWVSGREGWVPNFGGVSTTEFVNAAGETWDDGSLARAAGGGAAAWADGVNPFGDYFADQGFYDPCDSAFRFSKGVGELNRDAAVFVAVGGVLGRSVLKASGVTNPALGESLLVGRGAIGKMASEGTALMFGSRGGKVFDVLGVGAAAMYEGSAISDTYNALRDTLSPIKDCRK